IARQELAANAAVDLDELDAELLHRDEGHGAMAEAIDQQRAADRAEGIAEALAGAEPQQRIALVDLEEELIRRHQLGAELRGDEARKLLVVQGLAGKIDREARDARALRQAFHRVPHYPAVELRHHPVV